VESGTVYYTRALNLGVANVMWSLFLPAIPERLKDDELQWRANDGLRGSASSVVMAKFDPYTIDTS